MFFLSHDIDFWLNDNPNNHIIVPYNYTYHIPCTTYHFTLCISFRCKLFVCSTIHKRRNVVVLPVLAHTFCEISQTKLSSLTFLSWLQFFCMCIIQSGYLYIVIYKWTEARIINIIIRNKKVYIYAVHKIWNVPKVFANIPL